MAWIRMLAVALALSGTARADSIVERAAERLADRSLCATLTVENVVERVRPVIALSAPAADGVMMYARAKSEDVHWALASFIRRKDGYHFESLSIALEPRPDLGTLEAQTRAALEKRLGKPRRDREEGAWVWRIGRCELSLYAGPSTNPLAGGREDDVVELTLKSLSTR
jgi:hypothetical protein